jgi:4-amino-4-deoxy-L-arabinose transferase-like glycosyltransferase
MNDLNRYAMVFLISLAILVTGISVPPVAFDEPAYVGAARNFIAGTPSTNPEHPPLAKYLIALSIETFGDYTFGWRFASAIAGALLALSIFGLTLRLTSNPHSAYVAWLLVMVNGFWFVMGRIALLPIFDLAFEAAGVWVFIVATQRKNPRWFAWSGVLFGLSAASRWSGVFGLLVCLAYALVYHRPFLKNAILMTATAILAYAASWVPLMVREHRPPIYLLTANQFILEFHRHITADPRLGQSWWTWIFRFQPQPSLFYLLGNPFVGIFGLAAVAVLIWRKQPLLPALYIAHVLQWAIAIRPLTFYYHYFEAFTWLTVALAVAMQGVVLRRVRIDVVATACAAAVFLELCAL